MAGRLMALADVYDALRSQRVYKPAYPHAKGRDIIVAARGAQFDPDVVDAFLALEDRFVEIAVEFADPEHAETKPEGETWKTGQGRRTGFSVRSPNPFARGK